MDKEWGKIISEAVDYLASKDRFDAKEVKSAKMIVEVMESKNSQRRKENEKDFGFIDPNWKTG